MRRLVLLVALAAVPAIGCVDGTTPDCDASQCGPGFDGAPSPPVDGAAEAGDDGATDAPADAPPDAPLDAPADAPADAPRG